jgi:hypothetical protein
MTSVFLPFIAKTASVYDITHAFENIFQLGAVSRVDIVKKKDRCMAYVHFASWSNDENSLRFQTQIANGESVKVFYNDVQYWNVVANTYTQSTPVRANVGNKVPGAPVKRIRTQTHAPKSKVVRNLDAEFTEDLVDAAYVSRLEDELEMHRFYISGLDGEIAQLQHELTMYKLHRV